MKSFKNPFRTKYQIVRIDDEYVPQRKLFFGKWKRLSYHYSTSLQAAEYAIGGYLESAVEVIKTYN